MKFMFLYLYCYDESNTLQVTKRLTFSSQRCTPPPTQIPDFNKISVLYFVCVFVLKFRSHAGIQLPHFSTTQAAKLNTRKQNCSRFHRCRVSIILPPVDS